MSEFHGSFKVAMEIGRRCCFSKSLKTQQRSLFSKNNQTNTVFLNIPPSFYLSSLKLPSQPPACVWVEDFNFSSHGQRPRYISNCWCNLVPRGRWYLRYLIPINFQKTKPASFSKNCCSNKSCRGSVS